MRAIRRPFTIALVIALAIAALPVFSVLGQQPTQQTGSSVLPNSAENTSVLALNTGSEPAVIALDLYTPGGVLIPTATQLYLNVEPGASRTFEQAINTGLVRGFRGVGVLSSDQPITGLLVRDIVNRSDWAHSYAIAGVTRRTGQTVSLPYVANNLGNTFRTRFGISNTGTTVACVTITYAFIPGLGSVPSGGRAPLVDAGPGGQGCTSGYPIPAGGQISFAPDTSDGISMAMPTATRDAQLAATISSSGPAIAVTVDSWVNGTRKLASYDGFVVGEGGDLGTTIQVPVAIKSPDGFYSQILLSNPNDAATTATITYRGNTGTHTVNVPVPAQGTATHSVYSDNTVPVGFVGAATVTSPQPIAAVLFRMKMTTAGSYIDEDLYTAVNGVPSELGTTTAYLPIVFRRVYRTGGYDGFNSWVSVSVADGGTANVTLRSVNDPENPAPNCQGSATYTTTKTITGSFLFYQNLDVENGFGAAPTCFWGAMTIESDRPIIVYANVTSDILPGDNDALYNGLTP